MKWLGAILVVGSCGGFGCFLAAGYRCQVKQFRELYQILEFMQRELSYRLTTLPKLCSHAGRETEGTMRRVFFALSQALDQQFLPDVASCMQKWSEGRGSPVSKCAKIADPHGTIPGTL